MPTSSALDEPFVLPDDQIRALAGDFDLPLYVLSEAHLRHRIRRFKAAAEAAWPGAGVSFASKSNSTLAVVAIVLSEGCSIDVASEGELRAAILAGAPTEKCHLHGNCKSWREIEFGADSGVGYIVADSMEELDQLHQLGENCPDIVLRLAPGVDPITHKKIATGQADTKFGLNIADGSAEAGVKKCLQLNLPLIGFHSHVGSQLIDPQAQITGGELCAAFAAKMKKDHGFEAKLINVGGGLGIHYTENDHPMDPEPYCAAISNAIKQELEGTGLTPKLVHEPGRSLVGESGITIYRVGNVKHVPIAGGKRRTYVGVSGGLSDNPRPGLYDGKYRSILTPQEPRELAEMTQVRVSGRHCETDMLFDDVPLPADTQAGDLLQVLCTGAYSSSMASRYNRYLIPPTVLVRENGRNEVIQRPEEFSEMFAREIIPEDLA
jgi:diaminopimelate decarboxylase